MKKRVALAILLAIAGCGGGGSQNQPTQFNIVGTWHVIRKEYLNNTFTCPSDACAANETWTFGADGTLTRHNPDGNLTYSVVSGNELTVNGDTTYTYHGDGDTLWFQVPRAPEAGTYERWVTVRVQP